MPPIPSGSIIKTENRTLTRRPLGNSRYTGSQINKSDDYDTDWINHLALGDLVQGIPPLARRTVASTTPPCSNCGSPSPTARWTLTSVSPRGRPTASTPSLIERPSTAAPGRGQPFASVATGRKYFSIQPSGRHRRAPADAYGRQIRVVTSSGDRDTPDTGRGSSGAVGPTGWNWRRIRSYAPATRGPLSKRLHEYHR